jgi:hypothetical protein
MERGASDPTQPETQDSHNPPNKPDCTCMGCRHFQEQARMERLRSTIRSRKDLYEGLANMPTPTDPHGTGCGCEWRGGRPFRCDYHQGYVDGRVESSHIIAEMQAKLDHANGRISREVMLDRIMEARG